jgi:hypothetical protein
VLSDVRFTPKKRTSLNVIAMSAKRKSGHSAPQQTMPYSITSSARVNSDGGPLMSPFVVWIDTANGNQRAIHCDTRH